LPTWRTWYQLVASAALIQVKAMTAQLGNALTAD
jgi:hypothetical protein